MQRRLYLQKSVPKTVTTDEAGVNIVSSVIKPRRVTALPYEACTCATVVVRGSDFKGIQAGRCKHGSGPGVKRRSKVPPRLPVPSLGYFVIRSLVGSGYHVELPEEIEGFMFTRASGGTTSVKASDSEDVDKVAGSHSNLESESESKSFQSVGGSQSQIGQTPDLLESLYYPTYNPSDVTWSPTSKGSHPDLWFHVISLLHPSMLPKQFGMIQIPLEDPHVLKFQTIVPTPRFSLLTIANLSHSTRVDDESIVVLKDLHNLTSLDISGTKVSYRGIDVLSRSLGVVKDEDEGPVAGKGEGKKKLVGLWRLRMLYLLGCWGIDNRVCRALGKWPLLFLVDLRRTRCVSPRIPGWDSQDRLEVTDNLLPPQRATNILKFLHPSYPDLFPTPLDNTSSRLPYFLYIDQELYPDTNTRDRDELPMPIRPYRSLLAPIRPWVHHPDGLNSSCRFSDDSLDEESYRWDDDIDEDHLEESLVPARLWPHHPHGLSSPYHRSDDSFSNEEPYRSDDDIDEDRPEESLVPAHPWPHHPDGLNHNGGDSSDEESSRPDDDIEDHPEEPLRPLYPDEPYHFGNDSFSDEGSYRSDDDIGEDRPEGPLRPLYPDGPYHFGNDSFSDEGSYRSDDDIDENHPEEPLVPLYPDGPYHPGDGYFSDEGSYRSDGRPHRTRGSGDFPDSGISDGGGGDSRNRSPPTRGWYSGAKRTLNRERYQYAVDFAMKDDDARKYLVLARKPPPYMMSLLAVVQQSIAHEELRKSHEQNIRMLNGDENIPADFKHGGSRAIKTIARGRLFKNYSRQSREDVPEDGCRIDPFPTSAKPPSFCSKVNSSISALNHPSSQITPEQAKSSASVPIPRQTPFGRPALKFSLTGTASQRPTTHERGRTHPVKGQNWRNFGKDSTSFTVPEPSTTVPQKRTATQDDLQGDRTSGKRPSRPSKTTKSKQAKPAGQSDLRSFFTGR